MRNGLAIAASIFVLTACSGSSSDDPLAAVPSPNLADPAPANSQKADVSAAEAQRIADGVRLNKALIASASASRMLMSSNWRRSKTPNK